MGLPGIAKDIFKGLLHFVYTGELNSTYEDLDSIRALLKLANRFACVSLKLDLEARRSRLNCWERESLRTTGSKRSRKRSLNITNVQTTRGRRILDEYIFNNEAEHEATGIVAAHIWKASTRGHGLEEFGLKPEDVNSPRNGLFLTKALGETLDHQQACFLYNLLENKLVLWVADTSLMNKTIAGSGMTVSDVHQKPLLCPPDCLPYRRRLSWHARLTLELRPQTVVARHFTSAYDSARIHRDRNTTTR